MPDAASPALPDMNDATYQRALAVLLDVGTSIAQELKTPSPDTPVKIRAKAFDAVSLAVRRTIILSRHITDTAAKPPLDPDTQRTERRKQVIRSVEGTIADKADPADAPALRVELLERLDSPEFDVDLTHRPLGQLIVELCQDLGLANIRGLRHFPRRTPEDIATLCAQAAAAPGSGLPQWLAATTAQATQNDATSFSLTPRERAGVRATPHAHPPPPS